MDSLEGFMRPVIGAVALAALAVGGTAVVATSRQPSSTQAYQSTDPAATYAIPAAPATLAAVPAAPATAPVAVAEATTPATKVVYRDRVVSRKAPARRRVVTQKRSGKKSAAIIGGSTVGGAVIGGLVGGKKGAVIGGLAGGTAGTVYDRKTRKKRRVIVQ
jgi:uncharacterized protein YcfJ